MRILQVIHQFPPHSSQGSEVYCSSLSEELARSADVHVFHISNAPGIWRRQLQRESRGRLTEWHCIDGGQYARLADWPNQFLRRSFQSVLDEVRPEVVHFHNFLSLGDDLVSRARAAGAAVVYTLHDFGLVCPNALLLRDDGVLCGKDRSDFFQDCCPVLIRTTTRGHRTPPKSRLPSLARWQRYARQSPRPAIRATLLALTELVARWRIEPRHFDVERKRDFFFRHTRQIFRDADLFLAPSRFLLDRYVRCGIPPEKVALERYGVRHFQRVRRPDHAGPTRFGYIGALHPQKGLDLLLEAFRDVADRASLRVFGSVFGSPISQSFWRRIRATAATNVEFRGAYENEDVGKILADLDVVVVPSLWYENSPLTIQEAFIGGVPVITADVGGMAELVADGVGGLRFRVGDVADLSRKMRQIVDDPETIIRLRRTIPAVPTIEEQAAGLLARYRELSTERRAGFVSPPLRQ